MPTAYEQLVQRLRRVHALDEAAAHLQWDQETYMPSGGLEARARQLEVLKTLSHELFTDDAVGRWLEEAAAASPGPTQEALLRETRWAYERATRVPTELVERLARAVAESLPIWMTARSGADFSMFEPALSRLVQLKRDYAEAIDPGAEPYEVLFADYEPWLPLSTASSVLDELERGLGPIIEAAVEASADVPNPFEGRWPAERQVAFNERVLDLLGYPRDHGRLDTSPHPFSTGNVYDARITTRYDESDPISALESAIHEYGHALYTLGLPKEHFGTPLGDARDLVVHESQSRLWENHVGRTLAFWERILPIFQDAFPNAPGQLTPEAAYRASNRVAPTHIRVDSDELTYHMHIIMRYRIEADIFAGRLDVAAVPHVWNETTEELLGITPPDDGAGCLQDIHWAHGSFGYFPTYSMGSVLAAQFAETFEAAHGRIEQIIRDNDLAILRDWLREHVHRHGKRYTTPELIQRATGGPLQAKPFLEHARNKYASGL